MDCIAKHRCQGLTLIELLITLSVIAILAMVAVPSFQTIVKDNRIREQSTDLLISLKLARSEAVKRDQDITLLRTSGSLTCTGSDTPWEGGWQVFIDSDSDQTIDSGELLLRKQLALSGGNTLCVNGSSTTYLTYQPDGTANVSRTLTLCDSRGSSHAKAVIVDSTTGRARISTTQSDGSSLNCP